MLLASLPWPPTLMGRHEHHSHYAPPAPPYSVTPAPLDTRPHPLSPCCPANAPFASALSTLSTFGMHFMTPSGPTKLKWYPPPLVQGDPCPRGTPWSDRHFLNLHFFFVPKAAKMFWVPMTHYYLCHPTSCGNLHNSVAAYLMWHVLLLVMNGSPVLAPQAPRFWLPAQFG